MTTSTPVELDLPLGNAEAERLASQRQRHLMSVPGIDPAAAARLAHAFPTLAAVYAADEGRLRALIGPVAAARLRWFLDAPLARPQEGLPGRHPWNRAA